MILLVSGATRYPRDARIGHLIVPRQWNDPASLDLSAPYAFDNGAFSGFDEGAFVRMLERYSGLGGRTEGNGCDGSTSAGCLFAAAPDVVGDAASTRSRWPFWSRLIHGLGLPPAFVAQDGLGQCDTPWDELACLFIGGSTKFKESLQVRDLVLAARHRDVWVHWGRVNSKRRLELIMKAMGDYPKWSFDGTGFSMFPNTNIPKVGQWTEEIKAQPELGLCT